MLPCCRGAPQAGGSPAVGEQGSGSPQLPCQGKLPRGRDRHPRPRRARRTRWVLVQSSGGGFQQPIVLHSSVEARTRYPHVSTVNIRYSQSRRRPSSLFICRGTARKFCIWVPIQSDETQRRSLAAPTAAGAPPMAPGAGTALALLPRGALTRWQATSRVRRGHLGGARHRSAQRGEQLGRERRRRCWRHCFTQSPPARPGR